LIIIEHEKDISQDIPKMIHTNDEVHDF